MKKRDMGWVRMNGAMASSRVYTEGLLQLLGERKGWVRRDGEGG